MTLPTSVSSAPSTVASSTTTSLTRRRSDLRRLRMSDPAVRALTDFLQHPPLTIAEDCELDSALDDMFRLGVRAFLVVRNRKVVGLITVEDIRAVRRRAGMHVGEVMTGASDMPAIDWDTLQESSIRDLIDIFAGARINHLVVLERKSPLRASVRGIVHRSRIDSRLLPLGGRVL